MERKINILVLEDRNTEGIRISDALVDEDVQVHVVDSCAKAMNKMLEYMDLIVIDSRTCELTSGCVERIKGRVATTPVVAVGSERELRSIRCQGRVRADAYVTLPAAAPTLAARLLDAYGASARNAGGRGRFASAA